MTEAERASGRRFARRIWLPRAIGLSLGFLSFASVMWEQGASLPFWAGCVFFCFAWPHLAYAWALASRDPARTETRNLVIDCAVAGAWISLTGFNLLPSALAIAMFGMDRMSIGGARLTAICLGAMLVAGLAAAALFGFELRPEPSLLTVIASLPVMVAYPVAVGAVMHRSATRIREQNRRLAELTRIDGLSGLLNHVAWEETVAVEFQRTRRHGRPAAVMMLDIDHFKQVNDRHGHLVGDEVIRKVSAILRECARRLDAVGRCGGEEFGILLPETGVDAAALMAERIRKTMEEAMRRERVELRVTVSIGIAAVGPEMNDAAEWIDRADRALYQAKRLGRNRSIAAGPSLTGSIAA